MPSKIPKTKAQANSVELLVGYFIFAMALTIAITLWTTTWDNVNKAEKLDDFETTATYIAEKLVRTPGYPENWTPDNVITIGLANDPRILDNEKIEHFIDMMNDTHISSNPACSGISNYECNKYLFRSWKTRVLHGTAIHELDKRQLDDSKNRKPDMHGREKPRKRSRRRDNRRQNSNIPAKHHTDAIHPLAQRNRRPMKNKNSGYVMVLDALIALSIVLLVSAVIITEHESTTNRLSATAFKETHYISEDVLDVLNKQGALDSLGTDWAAANGSNPAWSNESNTTFRYLDLLIPKNTATASK